MNSNFMRILLFFVLPILAVLSYPPKTLASLAAALAVAIVFFVVIGLFLMQGRSLALTFAIFLQGINAIIRLMMFFPNSFSNTGEVNYTYLVTCLLGLVLSIWLLVRLDRQDVHISMTR
jgi:hypothetical protein